MSPHVQKGVCLALLWAHTLFLSTLLLLVARDAPVLANADVAAHKVMTSYLETGVQLAATHMNSAEANLEQALGRDTPARHVDASAQFDSLFSGLTALDTALAHYEASDKLAEPGNVLAGYPIRGLLGWAVAAMLLLCVGISIPRGVWDRIVGRAGAA